MAKPEHFLFQFNQTSPLLGGQSIYLWSKYEMQVQHSPEDKSGIKIVKRQFGAGLLVEECGSNRQDHGILNYFNHNFQC